MATIDQRDALSFGDTVTCKYCGGSGTEHSRYYDDTTGYYSTMEIACTGCGGNGSRIYHEETAIIDYLETRYDDCGDW